MPASNQAFRGASLYSGIFDTPDQAKDTQQEKLDPQASTPASNQAPSAHSSSSAPDAGPPTVAAASSDAAGPSKSSGWSAALRFAPRRTAVAAKAKTKPTAAFVASFAPPAASGMETVEPPKGALSRAPGVAPQPTISVPGPSSIPENAASTSVAAPEASSATSPDNSQSRSLASVDTSDLKLTALALPHAATDDAWIISQLAKHPITEPPPFTLPPEDLERDKAYAQRAAAARGESRHYSHYDDLDGEEEDADVNGFFSTGAGKRMAKKKKKRKRGTSPPAGPNMNAEYDPRVPNDYLAYKQLVYDRRKAELDFRRWQQEQEERGCKDDEWDEQWDDHEQGWQNDGEGKEADPLPRQGRPEEAEKPVTARISATIQASTGEEAYARRAAMSSAAASMAAAVPPNTGGEAAHQRRVAMTNVATGEEAYLRRLAMSQASPPGPRPRPPPGPPPGPPPSRPPPPPSQSASTSDSDSLASRQSSAAAAIAARLNSLRPPAPPSTSDATTTTSPSTTATCDPTTFASRLMTSYGYVPGTGLGASSNGILEPLTVSASKGRGEIINAASAAQTQAETSQFGSAQASPVIVLLNMASKADLAGEAYQELVEDVGEECGKFGYVKRVFACLVRSEEGEKRTKEAEGENEEVRVFVQFTGPAASWKAVRNLQGRWFEGKQVQAMYYDETGFEQGRFDLPLSRNKGS